MSRMCERVASLKYHPHENHEKNPALLLLSPSSSRHPFRCAALSWGASSHAPRHSFSSIWHPRPLHSYSRVREAQEGRAGAGEKKYEKFLSRNVLVIRGVVLELHCDSNVLQKSALLRSATTRVVSRKSVSPRYLFAVLSLLLHYLSSSFLLLSIPRGDTAMTSRRRPRANKEASQGATKTSAQTGPFRKGQDAPFIATVLPPFPFFALYEKPRGSFVSDDFAFFPRFTHRTHARQKERAGVKERAEGEQERKTKRTREEGGLKDFSEYYSSETHRIYLPSSAERRPTFLFTLESWLIPGRRGPRAISLHSAPATIIRLSRSWRILRLCGAARISIAREDRTDSDSLHTYSCA